MKTSMRVLLLLCVLLAVLFVTGAAAECTGVDGNGTCCGQVDCAYSIWSDWSECSELCNGGIQTRTRAILREPTMAGKLCSEDPKHYKEARGCNFDLCADPDWCEEVPMDIGILTFDPGSNDFTTYNELVQNITQNLIARDYNLRRPWVAQNVRIALAYDTGGNCVDWSYSLRANTTTIWENSEAAPAYGCGGDGNDNRYIASVDTMVRHLYLGNGSRSMDAVLGHGLRPDRPGARKVLIFMHIPESGDNYVTDDLIIGSHAPGLEVFTVYINENSNIPGFKVSKIEGSLRNFASEPKDQHFFTYRSTWEESYVNGYNRLFDALMASVRHETSRACTIYGSGHVTTFDGSNYELGAAGDFYLVKQSNHTYIGNEFTNRALYLRRKKYTKLTDPSYPDFNGGEPFPAYGGGLSGGGAFASSSAWDLDERNTPFQNGLYKDTDTMTVQVRMKPCFEESVYYDNTDNETKVEPGIRAHKGRVCPRGYLFTDRLQQTVEFEWMPEVANLWIWVNGQPYTPMYGTFLPGRNWYFSKMSGFNNTNSGTTGYTGNPARRSGSRVNHIDWSVQQIKTHNKNENGFKVQVRSGTQTKLVNIRFSPQGSVATIEYDAKTRETAYGLCGFWDGCAKNDFITSKGDVVPADSPLATIYEDFALSWRVPDDVNPSASHRNGARYTNQVWSPVFEPVLDSVFIANSPCSAHGPGRLLRDCLWDAQSFGASTAVESNELLAVNCERYCMYGGTLLTSSVFGAPEHPVTAAAICAHNCKWKNGAVHKPSIKRGGWVQNQMHSNPRDDFKFMPLGVKKSYLTYGSDLPTAFFLFSNGRNLGGKYTFLQSVRKHDFCGLNGTESAPSREVVVNVACMPLPDVHVGRDVDLHYGRFGYPLLELHGFINESSGPQRQFTRVYTIDWRIKRVQQDVNGSWVDNTGIWSIWRNHQNEEGYKRDPDSWKDNNQRAATATSKSIKWKRFNGAYLKRRNSLFPVFDLHKMKVSDIKPHRRFGLLSRGQDEGIDMFYGGGVPPLLQPDTLDGIYTIELAISDGCGVRRRTVDVHARTRCNAPDFRISPVHPIFWSPDAADPDRTRGASSGDPFYRETSKTVNYYRYYGAIKSSNGSALHVVMMDNYISKRYQQRGNLDRLDGSTFGRANGFNNHTYVNDDNSLERLRLSKASDYSWMWELVSFNPFVDSKRVSHWGIANRDDSDDDLRRGWSGKANHTLHYYFEAFKAEEVTNVDSQVFSYSKTSRARYYYGDLMKNMRVGTYDPTSDFGVHIPVTGKAVQRIGSIFSSNSLNGGSLDDDTHFRPDGAFNVFASLVIGWKLKRTENKEVSVERTTVTPGWNVSCHVSLESFDTPDARATFGLGNKLYDDVKRNTDTAGYRKNYYRKGKYRRANDTRPIGRYCTGVYEFQVTGNAKGYMRTCEQSQSVKIEVACPAHPVALFGTATETTIEFDYDNREWSAGRIFDFSYARSMKEFQNAQNSNKNHSLSDEVVFVSVPAGSMYAVGDVVQGVSKNRGNTWPTTCSSFRSRAHGFEDKNRLLPMCHFTPDVPGDYELELRSTNGCQEDFDSVTITATCPIDAPTAEIALMTGDLVYKGRGNPGNSNLFRANIDFPITKSGGVWQVTQRAPSSKFNTYPSGNTDQGNTTSTIAFNVSDHEVLRPGDMNRHLNYALNRSMRVISQPMLDGWPWGTIDSPVYRRLASELGGWSEPKVFQANQLSQNSVFPFNLTQAGTYEFEYTADDGCKSTTKTIEVEFICAAGSTDGLTAAIDDTNKTNNFMSYCTTPGHLPNTPGPNKPTCSKVSLESVATNWPYTRDQLNETAAWTAWYIISAPTGSVYDRASLSVSNNQRPLFKDFDQTGVDREKAQIVAFNTFEIFPDMAGDYEIGLMVYDGACAVDYATATVTAKCATTTGPRFQNNALGIQYVSDDRFSATDRSQLNRIHYDRALVFNYSLTSLGNKNFSYDVVLTEPMGATKGSWRSTNHSTYADIPPNNLDFTLGVPAVVTGKMRTLGDYNMEFTVCDHCGLCDTQSTDFTVVCNTSTTATDPYTVDYTAKAGADQSVSYTGTHFPRVSVDGSKSTWQGNALTTFTIMDYKLVSSWRVVSAPTESVYNPRDLQYTFDNETECTVEWKFFNGSSTRERVERCVTFSTVYDIEQTFSLGPGKTDNDFVPKVNNTYFAGAGWSVFGATALVPDVAGDYVLELKITDACGLTDTDRMTITAACNDAPVADAGDDISVEVRSNSRDVDADIAKYKEQTERAANGLTTKGQNVGRAGAHLTYYGNAGNPYRGDSAQVWLDGSMSSDPEGDVLNYTWSMVSWPEEAAFFVKKSWKIMAMAETRAYGSSSSALMRVDIPYEGEYVFKLEVSDGCSVSQESLVTVHGLPRPCVNPPVFNDTGVIPRNYDYLSEEGTEVFTLRSSNLYRRNEYFQNTGFSGSDKYNAKGIDEYAMFTQMPCDMRWNWQLVEHNTRFDVMHEEPCDSDVNGMSCACDPVCAERNLRANSQNHIFFVDSLRIGESIDDIATWWFAFIVTVLAIAFISVVVYYERLKRLSKKAVAAATVEAPLQSHAQESKDSAENSKASAEEPSSGVVQPDEVKVDFTVAAEPSLDVDEQSAADDDSDVEDYAPARAHGNEEGIEGIEMMLTRSVPAAFAAEE